MGFRYRKPEDFNGAYGADSDAGIFRQPDLYHASEQDEALLVGDDAVKATCYKALVRPHLEYSAIVRDPYTTKGMQAVEVVQRRAARNPPYQPPSEEPSLDDSLDVPFVVPDMFEMSPLMDSTPEDIA
ncbi:Hypp8298 [Branchiostoma lanceolatum]|uniref:Hypp8298 protein n=1 Tax=Branchiostoma lanceolatum TaxID=7740 RepID=A0A8J9Z6D5_BRALA|nr:Hypp8298 [Branchiostoma lanceolatum]